MGILATRADPMNILVLRSEFYGRFRAHFDGKVIIPDEPAIFRATSH